MPLHLEKKGIRSLGLAESFSKDDKFSTLAGVVMRSDLVVDGFGIGELSVAGSDATQSLIALFEKLKRNDINVILVSGSVLSLYNIVDVDMLSRKTKLPVIALTFKKSTSDLARNIRTKFGERSAKQKLKLLEELGIPKQFKLKTGYPVFARSSGLSDAQVTRILEKFTLQGAIPEPIRVARLLAKAVASCTQKRAKLVENKKIE